VLARKAAASSAARHPASASRQREKRDPRPSRTTLAAAHGRGIADVIAPGLKVLFVGINPGLYSGATGYHFARPGNRFWPALHAAGFTPRLLHPAEQRELLALGYGVTNLVNRATATADEIAPAEFVAGRRRLAAKVRRYRPRIVAFVGMGAYAHAFGLRKVAIGEQPEGFEGARVWVLPNPSGLNAGYQLPQLVALFRELKQAAGDTARRSAQRAQSPIGRRPGRTSGAPEC